MQQENIELSILIPTYNEVDVIETALVEISKELNPELLKQTEIIVVDDGTDNLVHKVKDLKNNFAFADITVYRNSPPLGKGKSLALGFQKARGKIVGFLDVDLSTPPRYIKMAYDHIKSGK